jgi:hypothetical protein
LASVPQTFDNVVVVPHSSQGRSNDISRGLLRSGGGFFVIPCTDPNFEWSVKANSFYREGIYVMNVTQQRVPAREGDLSGLGVSGHRDPGHAQIDDLKCQL